VHFAFRLFLGGFTVDRGKPKYDSMKISRCERANSSNEAEDEDREKYNLKRRPDAIRTLEQSLLKLCSCAYGEKSDEPVWFMTAAANIICEIV